MPVVPISRLVIVFSWSTVGLALMLNTACLFSHNPSVVPRRACESASEPRNSLRQASVSCCMHLQKKRLYLGCPGPEEGPSSLNARPIMAERQHKYVKYCEAISSMDIRFRTCLNILGVWILRKEGQKISSSSPIPSFGAAADGDADRNMILSSQPLGEEQPAPE